MASFVCSVDLRPMCLGGLSTTPPAVHLWHRDAGSTDKWHSECQALAGVPAKLHGVDQVIPDIGREQPLQFQISGKFLTMETGDFGFV